MWWRARAQRSTPSHRYLTRRRDQGPVFRSDSEGAGFSEHRARKRARFVFFTDLCEHLLRTASTADNPRLDRGPDHDRVELA